MRTMYEALKICAPITLMTFAIFTRSDMVVNPGWSQVLATLIVFAGTAGITFAMFGRFVGSTAGNIPLRIGLAALSFVALLHPNNTWALAAAAIVAPVTLFGVWRHVNLGGPATDLRLQPAQ